MWFQGVFSEDKKARHWDSQTKKSRHRNSKTKKPRHRVPVEFWPLCPLVIYRGQCALGRRYRFLNSVSNYIMWPLIWKLMLHWFQKCYLIYTPFKLCQHFKYWAKNTSPKENYALGFGLQTRLSLKLFNSLQKWKKDISWLKKTSFSFFCFFFNLRILQRSYVMFFTNIFLSMSSFIFRNGSSYPSSTVVTNIS